MSGATLTRGEALDAIDAAYARMPSLSALQDLSTSWIGHAIDEAGADELADMLRDYVAECCSSDEERSNGPKDSDDTGIPT